jgi:two-component system, NarL family, sensor histidine kinase BarA
MSYRSFNRSLGQTSLELKCLFLFGMFLAVVVTVSFFLYWNVTKKVVEQQNPDKGRMLVSQTLLAIHWELFEREEEFLVVAQEIVGELREEDPKWRFIQRPDKSLSAVGQGQSLSESEKKLMERFMPIPPDWGGDSDEIEYDGRLVSGGSQYQYYQPIRTKNSCLRICHPEFSRAGLILDPSGLGADSDELIEGELMGLATITIDNAPTQRAINRSWGWLLGVSIITAFLAMIAFYVVIRYVIVKPVRHLRDVSEAVGRGDLALRARIRTGDEFESLALAFNRMLRHLVDAQDELRLVNTNLDHKVDELAQLNMQLYEINRVKSDFMATMSHELRTPLNSILGFSDVLGSIDALDDKQKRYVQNIGKSGRMLLEMINNVLDLAKIESGKMEIRLTNFEIHQIVGAQCDMARPLTEKKNIDLDMEIEPHLPQMRQDQGRVQQIINNLLSNAIKFTPEGGLIKVAVRRSQRGRMVLRVIDTGVGISEDDQRTIFEKFRQGRTATSGGDAITREYPGTGLGLSIVKELCRLLDGEVSVQSELGTGSTFTVRLPWELEDRPRLDSPLTAGFEELSKPKLELTHAHRPPVPHSVPSAPEQGQGGNI